MHEAQCHVLLQKLPIFPCVHCFFVVMEGAGLNCPFGQRMQLTEPAACEYLPAAQRRQKDSAVAPVSDDHLPAPQFVQEDEPADEYLPAPQFAQETQPADEYVPAPQE